MPYTLDQLAEKCGAEIIRRGTQDAFDGVASLADAGPAKVAPFTSETYREALKTTQAGTVILATGTALKDVPASAAVLGAADPEIAFLALVESFNFLARPAPGISNSATINPSASIAGSAHIGPNVVIGAHVNVGSDCVIEANTVIGENCEIGEGTRIYPNVTLYPRIKLGKRVVVHAGCVFGADGFGFKFRDGRHVKVPHVGWVEIGDDVEVGANTCIDRGSLGPTRIGRGTKIDNLVQIAHNNNVGQHCILCGQVAMAGSCTLEDYVVLGGNVGLTDHTYMEKGARAGAKAGVNGRIPAGTEVWGLMATEKSKAFASYAGLRRLPSLFDRVRDLERALRAAQLLGKSDDPKPE